MKEYTVTYTAEVTEVVKDKSKFEEVFADANAREQAVKADLDVDDVHIKHLKVFEWDEEKDEANEG